MTKLRVYATNGKKPARNLNRGRGRRRRRQNEIDVDRLARHSVRKKTIPQRLGRNRKTDLLSRSPQQQKMKPRTHQAQKPQEADNPDHRKQRTPRTTTSETVLIAFGHHRTVSGSSSKAQQAGRGKDPTPTSNSSADRSTEPRQRNGTERT